MLQFDVGQIVPSTRDLLQVLSTRRRDNLAIVGEIAAEHAADDARRLDEANVSSFAVAEPGAAMTEVARSTKTVPTLCLAKVETREHCQHARFFGADGVCLDTALSPADWESLSRIARGMRMLPLAVIRKAEDLDFAMKVGARALVLRADQVDTVLALAQKAARSLTLVADIASEEGGVRGASLLTAETLRKLVRRVDAAVVGPSLHTAADFTELVAEVDP